MKEIVKYRDEEGRDLIEVKAGKIYPAIAIFTALLIIAMIIYTILNGTLTAGTLFYLLLFLLCPAYFFLYYFNRKVFYNDHLIIIGNLFGRKYTRQYSELSKVVINKAVGIQFVDGNGKNLTNIGLRYEGIGELFEMLERKGVSITERGFL